MKCLRARFANSIPNALVVSLWLSIGGASAQTPTTYTNLFRSSAQVSLCLTADTSNATGSAVRLSSCSGAINQAWTYRANQIVNGNGKCLSIAGTDANGNYLLQIYACNPTNLNQQWNFDGITASWGTNNKSLDTSDQIGEGVPVIARTCSDTDNPQQRWSYNAPSPRSVSTHGNLAPTRPAGVTTYSPSNGALVAAAWQAWMTTQCKAKTLTLGIAPGSYTVDAPLELPSACTGSTLWLDGVTLRYLDVTKNMLGIYYPNITINGGTFLYETLPFSQARVTAVTPNSIKFTVSAGYPLQWFANRSVFNFVLMDRRTRGPKVSGYYDYYSVPIAADGAPDRFVATLPDTRSIAVGDPITVRGPYSQCLYISGSFTTLNDITMHNCGGYAVYDTGAGPNTYRNFVLTFPPSNYPNTTEPPLLTSAADMFHSTAKLGPKIIGAHLEGSSDDGVAVNGRYYKAKNANGNLVVFDQFNDSVGSVVRLYDANMVYQGSFKILSTDYKNVTFDQAMSAGFDPATWNFAVIRGNGFELRDSFIGYHRARGLLLKASDAQIVGNTFLGASMQGILMQPEIYWQEADFSWNVLLSGNLVMQSPNALLINGYASNPAGHRDLRILSNIFKGRDNALQPSVAPGALLTLGKIQGLQLLDNRISNIGASTVILNAFDISGASAARNCLYGGLPAGVTLFKQVRTDLGADAMSANCP